MLVTRVLTAVVGIPIILALAYAGGYWWDGLIILLAVLSNYELMRMADNRSKTVMALASLACIALVLHPILKSLSLPSWWPLIAIIIIVIILLQVNYRIDPVQLGWAFFSTLYVGFLFSYAVGINHLARHGFIALLTVFLLTWASDTGGHQGLLIGQGHLMPAFQGGYSR